MDDPPKVSVIIPVRNEEKHIGRCLDSIIGQDYPGDRLEVIVVDAMSTDRTAEIVRGLGGGRVEVRLLRNEKIITPAGFNTGIRNSSGEIIVIAGGHCELKRDFVKTAVGKLAPEIWAVGGPIEAVGETLTARAIALAMSSRFGVGNSAFRTESDREIYTDTVPFPAYRRDVFERIGFYDEELVRSQDYDFNLRIRRAGGRILLVPSLKSVYFSRATIAGFIRQYFQYGYYKVRLLKKHSANLGWRYFVAPAFVVSLFLGGTAAFFPGGWMFLAMVLGPYLAADLAFSAAAMARKPGTECLLLPFCYPCLHLSFGTGFLSGLATLFRNILK